MSLRFGRHALSRLVGSLRGKSEKANEDLEALENIEREIERLRKRLNETRENASNLYVYGVDQDAIEIELGELNSQVEDLVDTVKNFSGSIKARYQASQQLVPSDITQHLTALELCAEATTQTMEEKQREQKRARTVRSDYLTDVDEVQAWIRQAELKVQDRSIEPAILRENLRQIQNELGTISDKLERLTRNGQTIVKNTRDDTEKELINSTIDNLTEQLAQIKSWLEEKKQIVGDTLDAWQRFLALYEAVKTWTEEKRQFLVEPLKLSTLQQARQRLHEYSTAVKSCKQVNKNLSDMGRELENIGQVTTVADLPEKLAEAEEGKVQVEGQLLERNALLQEASEEWEQCERKMKDVRSWMEKAKQTLELPQNKKKPLRDQHAIREKMLSDIAIQKTKITISVEKLEVHFRSGIVGDNRVKDIADDLIAELNTLHSTVKEQTTSLEVCLAQIDQYQQEIQQLRQHIVQVEQQLRTVLSPTYMPNDREKALQEQQSLQQRMEDWKQRSKTLVDQIHEVDPYYIPTNEYRFIGQASYADIAAGRTNSPSSRNCSPYRQREVTPPTMTAQILRPAVMQTQKLTTEHPLSLDEAQISKMQIHKNDTNINKSKSQLQTETRVPTTDDRNTIGAEECQQAVSEVELSMPRRGRSPTRKTSSSKVKNPKIIADQEGEIDKCDNLESGVNSREETQTEPAKNSLAPCEERRGRSPSPMWVPGSTSYADILRGCIQTTQSITAPAQPPRQKMVSLSEESRRGRMEVPRVEEVTEQDMTNAKKSQQVTEVQQIVPTQEIQAENVQIIETYSQPETEKTEDQNYTESEPTNWTDESLQDYNVLQHVKSYENVPQQQPTEIYDYMIPETMPELVGFIGSHLGTYPVSSYVYAPSGHHQQVQQLDQINLNPYDNSSLAYAPEHYVAPTAYLSASDIYQQTPMQQPVNDMRHTTAIVMEKPVEVPIIRQSEVPKDVSATELIDKPEQQKSVNISNVETSTTNKTEGRNTSSLNNMETKGQTFSYAQILSHGLSPRVTSTRIVNESTAANYQSKERSDSPKESLELPSRELSPLQEPKFKQESLSFAVTSDEQSKQSKENDWDTMKKREIRKKYQHSNDKIKQTDEKKSRKPIDKSKEKQKNEKLTPSKKLEMQDESFLDKISDRPMQKEEKVQQEQSAIDLDTNPSQEKKRRQKKKKIDKSVGDEIDKALKEIEDMDKQKIRSQKDKLKEQNKEIKSRDSVNETIEQHNDERQSKSDEKSRKSKKSKEATRTKETIFMEHAMLPSEIKANDKNILKDDVEDKKDTKDAKISDSKNEEKVQKDITKEMSKELQLDNNSHINSNKLDNVTKCKNKIDKDTKIKEQNGEASENKMQYQSDVLSNNKKDKINIVDENNVTKDVKLLVTQKIELEDINEKTNTSTKIENKKHKDASKKEKNKTKSKEIKLEAENSNINQEKLEISIKEIIEDKSLKSIKPLTDIEIKDSESKTLNITKIASDINESKKNKTNPRKKDKVSKNKIKSEAIIDPSSIISTNKVLDEIKINVNGTEKYVVSKSEQMIDAAKIAEATVVQETTKEILLPETVQQTAQEIVQIDKNDKTYDSARVKESKETEHQTNTELEVESFTAENLEIDTMDEKEEINNTKVIEKTKKPEVEKCQIKTTKQKKSEKTKSNVQDTRKENRTEISQHVENKIDKKEDELNIEFLIAPSKETIIQEQFSEKTNVAEQHVSVLDNSCLVQSKTDTENNYGVKIDKEENIVFGQVNISTEKSTVSETDLAKPTIITKNVEIISTTETFPEESEVSSEISNIVSDMEEKYRNIKNGKFDHHKETMIENEDIKTDINDKNSLTEDIKKSKDIAPKEKMLKRTKKKEHLSPKHAAEQTKQSFYDKFQEEIVFKHDSTKKEETSKFTNQSLPKIDNVDNEKTQESSNKNETETEFDSKVSSDSVDKAQVYKKYIDETHNNLESEQPSSTGKALIIEKMITTVTTTTSVPGSVKVKPPDVKSVKSVEIIENIPFPKIVGSKVIELITLRPETVEASLTTTYARVPNDSLVSMQSDQAAISQKVGLTSAISTESNVISDEMILFGSVQDRRRVCSSTPENRDMSNKSPPMTSPKEEKGEIITQLNDIEGLENQLKVEISEEKRENEKENTVITTSENIAVGSILTQNDNIIEDQNIDNSDKNNYNILSETSQADSNILIENDKCTNENEVNVANTITNNIQEKVDRKTEFTKECESEHTIRKIKSKEIPESSKIKKEIVSEHLLDLIKPYAMDRHAYNHAESNFHRYFKVVKTVKKVQPAITVHTRPESIERIVQDSIMKPIDVKSSNQEMNESNYRRHAFIIEAPKYPITSFYEFESQWIKMKFMPEKSVSISSDDSQVSVKTAIEREKQIVNEKEAINVVSDFTKDTIAIVEKLETIETNDSEDKDKKSKDLQQSVHLVSDDSWMSILDEPMMIEDDFDDTFNSEENTIDETVDTKLIDIENQYRTNEVQIQEKRLSENISEVVEIPSCIESIEEIREPTITLVSTSANNTLFNNNVKDLISITNDSILQSVIELNVSVEPSTEKISNNQLTDAEIIIDTNIQENKTDIKNNIETDQEIKEKPTKISSVHLESDDAWMALLEEEITIDDDFDELETIKDSQIKKREEDIEIKKAKTKQEIEEKEIKKKKSIIEKQEATVEQKKESIIEEQQQKIEKETIIEKPEEIKEKNVIEKHEEDIEIKEQKTEILNDTSLTEIAVKDEYHTNIKDIKNETVMNEKQNDKTKNQPRKKKELKHAKVTKTKDQAKAKTTNKQSDNIKTDIIKDDLSLQSNLEEHKLENKSDCKTKETEKSLIIDKQQVESHKDKEECEKREERKPKSKKSKKQNQRSEIILKEKSALMKCEDNLNKDDSIVLSKAAESDVTFETSSIVENQKQESKDDMPKYDSRLNPNAKSWAAIVGKKGTTETTVTMKDDFLITQTSAIIQDTNDNVTNVVKEAPIEYDSCEIPSKEETLTTHLPLLEKQNDIEELKAIVDEIKPIEEKSTELLKQLKESNKSYAQVTASSRRTSPQISQEETYSVKTIPLKTDYSAINVKTPISNEMHEDFITEELQSPLEQDNKQDEMIVQSSDYKTVIANLSSQEESIPWVEEVEKETMAVSTISIDSINTKDNETYVKSENTWATIVGKKSIESSEVNDIINLEQREQREFPKSEQNIEPPLQVQIYVEEAPKQEPIENLVQVDEQGFIEFVNRKELRSRRSRSRSRNTRQDKRYANKEIKALDVKSENSKDIKAKEEIENKIKQSVQKTENEQRAVDENDELTKIMKEENAKSSKSRDKDKQKNDSNENTMQFAENKSHIENKIIQETKPSATLKGKKIKSKNKAGKDYMKQQSEVNEHKELKHIEKPREDKSANENKTEYNKIQSENIEDQSIKEIELIKDTEHAQENKCKDIALPIINQDNTTKSKKKKNKKGKFVIELSESTFIDKKTAIAEDLKKKTELPLEPKLDEVKLEEVTIDMTCNILTYSENEEIPAEKIKRQENIKQVMIPTEKKTTEKESIEQKMIDDESKNAEIHTKSYLEKIEKNITEEKEIPKFTKAEKRKQKKKVKIAQSKFTDLSEDINTIENIKIKESASSKDKIDDESIIEIQSVQREEIEKPLEKFETVNETSLPHITSLKDKQKTKSKSKSKKEKQQQDDKTKSQNFTTTFITEPKEIETLSIVENTEVNLSKDIEICDITQTKEENIKDQILKDEIVEILQSPKNVITKDHFSIATETIKQEDIKELKGNILETEEVLKDIMTEKTEIDLPQTEESNNICLSKSDNILKLHDITINNDSTKIESVLISDKINDEIETPVNHICMQKELPCDSVNTAIKHSLSSNKLSSTVQQFEDEDKLKRIASTEQENSNILVESSKSKVQFYIADEILVLTPDRRKHVPSTSFSQEQSDSCTTDSCTINSWFLSIDDGFWPDKRPYHEAERDHFENLALHTKKNLSHNSKRDSDDRPQDHDDDNSGGGSGGSRSWDSCGNSCSLLGTPQTERMIADLPGGICSWSDYSTYLSSESERTMDHNLLLGTIEDPTLHSDLSLDNSLPNKIQSSSLPSQGPQTESCMESLANVEITPREYPVSSSNSFRSSNDPNTCTKSSTFTHLPQSKLHLGKETREGSVQRCSPNGEVERETAKGEAERIRRIQDIEEGLASLQARLLNLEGTMSYLPRDSIESMLSSLMTILMELRAYDEDAMQLQKRLQEIPADIESQKLSVTLTGIHIRVTFLLNQAEQGRTALEQAREIREKRGQEIHTYKLFLEETDTWLRNVVSKLHEQHSINTSKALQEELTSRAHQVSELESLPEVSALAIALKEALLDVIDRLQRKQQVSNASGAFANITTLHGGSVA